MKKFLLFLCVLPLVCFGQPGLIYQVTGNGTNGFSGDGGPATAALMGYAMGVFADDFGNSYVIDGGNGRIRKVSASGIITTIAGGGTSTSDGIPATDASLSLAGAAGAIDFFGNIYITDANRIRKVNTAGVITTVAGTGLSGFSGDGGPATAAKLSSPHGICLDPSGNMYIGDGGNSRIRKVSTSGIITTIAGTGAGGFSGDGGPATAAKLNSPEGICFDGAGNLYIADRYNFRIRKINAAGVINTIAGIGISGFSGDGGFAVGAKFNEPSSVCTDSYGNLYIADYLNSRVRRVTPSGVINSFAGGPPPIVPGAFGTVWGIGIDNYNNVYIADRNYFRVWKVSGLPSTPTYATGDFSVFVKPLCGGPAITILPGTYSPSLQVRTLFGDGTTRVDSFSSFWGYVSFNHAYTFPGTYTIKHVLYNSSAAVDSLQYSYSYMLCNTTFQVDFYYDADSNCVKDTSDPMLFLPVTIEVELNGVAIDTLSTISGLYYNAHGSPGDVFSFKIITLPGGFHASCPIGGVVYDTLGFSTSSTKYMGVGGSIGTDFDLGIHSIAVTTGIHRQTGNIYVHNEYCTPTNATVTLYYSPKFSGLLTAVSPAPLSMSGNSITWSLSALSSTQSAPVRLHYEALRVIGGSLSDLPIGDTVHSLCVIDGGAGDANPLNNVDARVDTVKAGCDPNHIWVSPEECMPISASSMSLKYTVNFENTGNDTAHNIYVLDTLSPYLDPTSMRMVMSSHEMYVSRQTDVSGRTILKFDFPNIKLLDSSHHGLCDGAFIYTINTKPGIPLGASVHGRVGIYFDVNDVVLTNTVENRKGCPDELLVSDPTHTKPVLYPNPVNEELVVQADVSVYSSFTITNSVGQEVIQQHISNSQTRVDVKALPAGIYYVVICGVKGKEVMKFVKK